MDIDEAIGHAVGQLRQGRTRPEIRQELIDAGMGADEARKAVRLAGGLLETDPHSSRSPAARLWMIRGGVLLAAGVTWLLLTWLLAGKVGAMDVLGVGVLVVIAAFIVAKRAR